MAMASKWQRSAAGKSGGGGPEPLAQRGDAGAAPLELRLELGGQEAHPVIAEAIWLGEILFEVGEDAFRALEQGIERGMERREIGLQPAIAGDMLVGLPLLFRVHAGLEVGLEGLAPTGRARQGAIIERGLRLCHGLSL